VFLLSYFIFLQIWILASVQLGHGVYCMIHIDMVSCNCNYRIAVCVLGPKNYCYNSKRLSGPVQTKKRHLEIMNYKFLEVIIIVYVFFNHSLISTQAIWQHKICICVLCIFCLINNVLTHNFQYQTVRVLMHLSLKPWLSGRIMYLSAVHAKQTSYGVISHINFRLCCVFLWCTRITLLAFVSQHEMLINNDWTIVWIVLYIVQLTYKTYSKTAYCLCPCLKNNMHITLFLQLCL